MTDPAPPTPLDIEQAAPEALLAVEIWDDAIAASVALVDLMGPPPAPGRAAAWGDRRILWWEPQTLLLRAPLATRETLRGALGEALSGCGAVTDVSGGFRRLRLRGPAWRDLLMIGAVFDAEHSFPVGSVVGTVIHHLPVRLDAVDAETADAYVLPSYAEDLLHHWRKAVGRMGSSLTR